MHSGARIHETAIVDAAAELGPDVDIGPYCVVGPEVRLGAGCRLHAHVVVEGPCELGRRNIVYPFAVVGITPQHKRDSGKASRLIMGDDNVIREHATLHRGTGVGETRVGSRNLFMVGCHVGHDVILGSDVAVANGVQLAGHTQVADFVTFGGLSGLSQHVKVGESAFVAAGAMCERDVPPFVIVQGDRARVRGLNVVGLRRRGVPERSILALRRAVSTLFVQRSVPRAVAVQRYATDDPYVGKLLAALQL